MWNTSKAWGMKPPESTPDMPALRDAVWRSQSWPWTAFSRRVPWLNIRPGRIVLASLLVLLAACAPAPPPPPKVAVDPVTESWYAPAIAELATMNREAASLIEARKPDDAAALIAKAQSLATRLLSAARPPLEAMEAASDVENLYAIMLLENKNYGWARLSYQKNVSRWKNWRPQSEETARRLKQAQAGIAEVDKRITQ